MIALLKLSHSTRFLWKRITPIVPFVTYFILQVPGDVASQQYLPAERKGDWQKAGSIRHFNDQIHVTRINRLPDYGADGTGAQPTKNVLAFRAAIADQSQTGITMIYIPQGTYRLDSIVNLDNVKNVIVSGAGSSETRLLFNLGGADNKACFSVQNCDTVGIENLYIERSDASNFGDNISFVNTRNSWAAGVESFKAVSTNISIYFSSHVEVRGCCIHHAWGYGKGGYGYGVVIGGNSTASLIEDNIFYHLRHSVILSNGPCNNVIGYNFSTNPYTTEKYLGISDWPSDMCLHGHPDDYPGPSRNLFEGNLCAFMHADDAWHDNGPFNTYFRNKATYYGLKIYKESNSQNVIANEVNDRDGSLPDLLWNSFNIQSTDNFVLGNTNYDSDPDDSPSEGNFSADLSLYYNSDSLPVFLRSLAYFPPFGAVNKDHPGGGTIPARQRWDTGEIKTVLIGHSIGSDVRKYPQTPLHNIPASGARIRHISCKGRTVIKLTVGSASSSQLVIYTLKGHRIRTFRFAKHPAGTRVITWDGKDDGGRQAPPGQYVCIAIAGTTVFSREILFFP